MVSRSGSAEHRGPGPPPFCSCGGAVFFLLYVVHAGFPVPLIPHPSSVSPCMRRRVGISPVSNDTHPRPLKGAVENVLGLWVQSGCGEGAGNGGTGGLSEPHLWSQCFGFCSSPLPAIFLEFCSQASPGQPATCWFCRKS